MAHPGVQALAVLRGRAAGGTHGRAQNQRHFEFAAGHVVDFRGLIDHWSIVKVIKSPNIISTTGRMPVIAAPTPMPVMPGSEIGESMTLWCRTLSPDRSTL